MTLEFSGQPFFSHVPYYIKRLEQIQNYLNSEMSEFESLEKQAWIEIKQARNIEPRKTRAKRQYHGQCQCNHWHECPPGPRGKPGVTKLF